VRTRSLVTIKKIKIGLARDSALSPSMVADVLRLAYPDAELAVTRRKVNRDSIDILNGRSSITVAEMRGTARIHNILRDMDSDVQETSALLGSILAGHDDHRR
jgi:hypothetical protein